MYEVGFGKVEIDAARPGEVMMGWAQAHHTIESVAMAMYCRAMVVRSAESGRCFAWVVIDTSSISERVRRYVDSWIQHEGPRGLEVATTVLSATHTHSSPGGYLDWPFFWPVNPYRQWVVDELVRGITESLAAAHAALQAADVAWHTAEVPLTDDIAFNRSIDAYNANEDVDSVADDATPEATDRVLQAIVARNKEGGSALGALTFFATHGTVVHSDLHQVHPDNKGTAAEALEAQMRSEGHPGFVALMAQACAGDVSPNFRYDKARKVNIGKFEDDYETVAYVGECQANAAYRALQAPGRAVKGTIDGVLEKVDMDGYEIEDRWTGCGPQFTGSAVIGVAMAMGTAEGTGPARPFRKRLKAWVQSRQRAQAKRELDPRSAAAIQGPKLPLMEAGLGGRGKALGVFPLGAKWIPTFFDDFARRYKRTTQGLDPERRKMPFFPNYVLVQVVRLGPIVVAALPLEPTTVAGRRLRQLLCEASQGSTEETLPVVAGYTNQYTGYLTTQEEYRVQEYEGGFTVYGQWQFAAFQSMLSRLSSSLSAPL